MKRTQFETSCVVISCFVFFLSACSAGRFFDQNRALANMEAPVVLEKTGQDGRPEWISEKPYFEDVNGYQFTGGIVGGTDFGLTMRLAKAEATKNLLESIQVKASGEFSSAVQGQNQTDSDLGRYATDAVAWIIDNLSIGGIQQKQIYYERIFDPASQSVKYNIWVQLEIGRSDYQKAKIDAAERLLNRAVLEKDQEAKKKAEELLDKLRQEL
jgi:hypothetical protein